MAKLLDMNDDLGDIMYAANEQEMEKIWTAFQLTYDSKKQFLDYF